MILPNASISAWRSLAAASIILCSRVVVVDVAEGEGFEPSTGRPVLVFKASAIGLSANLPSAT